MVNKGVTHKYRNESESARSSWRTVVEQYEDRDSPELIVLVATSLGFLASIQIELGNASNALHMAETVEAKFRAFAQDQRFALQLWRTMLTKSCALFSLRNRTAALDAFQLACEEFDAKDNAMVEYFLARLPVLMSLGASVGELAEVLAAEGNSTGAIEALVVALRRLAGESVRAAAEVLEVAEDVREQIEKDAPMSDSEEGQ